jgi:hypothetical protein
MGPAFSRKYGIGTGADIYLPIIKRGAVDFAVSGDWSPAAGDVKVSKDGGAAANIGTLPTAVTMGNGAMWKFVFSDSELQCKLLAVTVVDAATKAVEDTMFLIETYGHASAMFPPDLGDSVRLGLTALPNATAGANTGLPVVGTQIPNANAAANGGLPTVNGSNQVAGVSGDIAGKVLGGGSGTITGTGVRAVDASGNAIAPAATALSTADWTSARAAKLDHLDVDVGSRLASAGYTPPDNATIAAIAGYVDTEIAAIKSKTDNLPVNPAAAGDPMTLTTGERNAVADALLDRADGVETGESPRQALRLVRAATVGKSDGFPDGPAHFRDKADAKNRITATVDADGNRTAVTTDTT